MHLQHTKTAQLLTAEQVCLCYHIRLTTLHRMVDALVVTPNGNSDGQWLFTHRMTQRIHAALRLRQDLSVNFAGTALALDLLDEIQQLKSRLAKQVDDEH